jgi:hypothetical protein
MIRPGKRPLVRGSRRRYLTDADAPRSGTEASLVAVLAVDTCDRGLRTAGEIHSASVPQRDGGNPVIRTEALGGRNQVAHNAGGASRTVPRGQRYVR